MGRIQAGRRRTRRQARQAAEVESLETRQLLVGGPDTLGKEFWLAFELNDDADNGPTTRSLFLSSPVQASVTVAVPGMGWTQDYTVQAGQATTVVMPADTYASSADGISAVGIHVTSDQDIAVYGLNYMQYSTDGFTALPVDALDTSYMAIAHDSFHWGSEFAVVATQDQTTITVTPGALAGGRAAGVSYAIALSQGDVYQLSSVYDLTGSWITSDKPVAVFSGSQLAGIPSDYTAADHLVEQLTPISAWGSHFVTVPLAGRANGDTFRVLAAADGTEVRIDGVPKATLPAGRYYEWVGASSQAITTSKPVTLAQYANSAKFDSPDNTLGDPFMAIIPPVEQSLTQYTIATPASGFGAHYINLWIVPGTTVLLDGQVVPASDFIPIGNSGYVSLSQQVGTGTHTVVGSAPVGMMLYGWQVWGSYAYVGGADFSPAVPVASLSSDTPAADGVVPRAQPVSVVATDALGQPVPGVCVDFAVAGANPMTGFAVTDSQGRATYWYTATSAGLDTITATIGNCNATSTVLWHAAANQSIATGLLTTYRGTVADADAISDAITYVALTSPEHGSLTFLADGHFTYKPVEGYLGLDAFTFKVVGGYGESDVATVSISVAPVISDQSMSVPENSPAGAVVGEVAAFVPDGCVLSYAIMDGDSDGIFAIDPATGQITVAQAGHLDFETGVLRYSVLVQATDNAVPTRSTQATVTIDVTNVNEVPTGLALSNAVILENSAADAAIGSFLAAPDAFDSLTFTLVDGTGAQDNGLFTISDDWLHAAAVFDHEAGSTYSIRVRCNESGGLFAEKVFTISVLNVNERPTDITLSNSSIAERQPAGTEVGLLLAVDPDAGNTFTYTLVTGTGSTNNALFRVVGNSLRAAGVLNYEAMPTCSIRVRAMDQGGLWFERALTISVTDVNDAAPLVITGTAGNDSISIAAAAGQYTITNNGVVSHAWIGEVSSITINALDGDDTITIGSGVMACTLDGGLGNDSITGGEGSDSIRGDGGNDTIYGGAGNDSIMGNTGDDRMYAGDGDDQIQAGLGADSLEGGLGNDYLYGGDQSDTILGQEGDDYIEGRGKMDTIYGGVGNDTIYGGAGSDKIYGEDGDDLIDVGVSTVFHDTVDGGAGTDLIRSDSDDVLTECEGVWLV